MCNARLTLLVGVLTATVLGIPAAGQIPEGWEIVEITNDPDFYDDRPDINDRGQIVFHRRRYPSQTDYEIWLYDRGELIQITDDDVPDTFPRVNNRTEIVWSRYGEDDGIADIMLWRDGVVEVVSGQPYHEGSPDINDAGQIVWDARLEGEYQSGEIFLLDGTAIIQITDDASNEFCPRINENGQIAWTRYSGRYGIMLYDAGVVRHISGDLWHPRQTDLNDLVQVVWHTADFYLYLWEDDEAAQLLGYGIAGTINNRGEVCFYRMDTAAGNDALWLLRQGAILQLTDGFFGGDLSEINQAGEIAFRSGRYPTNNIALFTNPIVRADFDFDEHADLADFAILQNCLDRPEPLERTCLLADRDFDNDVDLTDFEAWFALFAGPKHGA